TKQGFALRAVRFPDLDLVERKFARRLRQQRLHHDNALHATWRALRPARRGVGENRHCAPTHRGWLIQKRNDVSRCTCIPYGVVRAVITNDIHVERGDAAILGETYLHAPLESRARASDEGFFFTADAHHHRSTGLFRQQRRDNREDISRCLTAESTTRVLANEHDLAWIHI